MITEVVSGTGLAKQGFGKWKADTKRLADSFGNALGKDENRVRRESSDIHSGDRFEAATFEQAPQFKPMSIKPIS